MSPLHGSSEIHTSFAGSRHCGGRPNDTFSVDDRETVGCDVIPTKLVDILYVGLWRDSEVFAGRVCLNETLYEKLPQLVNLCTYERACQLAIVLGE